MRKQWIKPESLYHKPFYKKKFQMTLLGVFLMAVIFFAYQLFYIRQLQIEIEHKAVVVPVSPAGAQEKSTQEKQTKRILRGIRLKDYDLYNPVLRNIFFCLQSGTAIPIERLNDDYCDCEEDGSDEPETNACANGVFYCSMTHQKRHLTGRGRGREHSVPTSRINDGICDCCDGSDEWLERNGKRVNCKNTCAIA